MSPEDLEYAEETDLGPSVSRLDLRVKHVMAPNPLMVEIQSPVERVARAMGENGCGSCLVTSEGKVVGIVTERDIVRRFAAVGAEASTPVGEIMSNPIVALGPEATVEEALELMAEKRIRRLPVVSDRDLVGIVTLTDIAKALGTKVGVTNSLMKVLTSERTTKPADVYR